MGRPPDRMCRGCRSRKWVFPNVQKVLLYSQGLGRKIRLPVTTAALK